jgi:hypothetical protein
VPSFIVTRSWIVPLLHGFILVVLTAPGHQMMSCREGTLWGVANIHLLSPARQQLTYTHIAWTIIITKRLAPEGILVLSSLSTTDLIERVGEGRCNAFGFLLQTQLGESPRSSRLFPISEG